MKRTICAVAIAATLGLTGCAGGTGGNNYTYFDAVREYNYAYVALPTGEVIEGKVDTWKDYEDGDQLQVVINGDTYLSNSSNIVLVARK